MVERKCERSQQLLTTLLYQTDHKNDIKDTSEMSWFVTKETAGGDGSNSPFGNRLLSKKIYIKNKNRKKITYTVFVIRKQQIFIITAC